jgi:3-oxoacyl-(acyl-carrier-protein) synthase
MSTACASGLTALCTGIDRIKSGAADTVITGGADAAVNHFTLNLFCSAGFLNTENDNPDKALCPFDLRRTRSVLGEGACIVIIEELDHAIARGAPIYCEIVGYHQEYENFDEMFKTDLSGTRWSEVIKRAIEMSGEKIDYINAHGTSDASLDAVESRAIRKALEKEDVLAITTSSIKGAVGSPFAAAGAMQIAATCFALQRRLIPPNRNYKIIDPDCRLRIAALPVRPKKLHQALVNGHAYGGVNVSLVLREMD